MRPVCQRKPAIKRPALGPEAPAPGPVPAPAPAPAPLAPSNNLFQEFMRTFIERA